MAFKLNRKALAAELALLGSVIKDERTIPVLACVRVVCDGSVARLTGSSLDVTVDTQLAGEGEPWSGCLPWKQWAALVKALDADEVVIDQKDSGPCEIRAGRSRTRLAVIPVDQFPNPDNQSGALSEFSVAGASLRDGLRCVLPCVTTEESRYAMQGVQFELSDEAFRLVATDGHRLGVVTLPPVGLTAKALVPALGLRPLLALESETIVIQLSDNVVTFRADGRTVTVRLAGGQFPSWQLIIPKDLPYHSEVDGDQLSGALKRAAITRGGTVKTGAGLVRDGVRLTFAADSLAVVVDENDRGAFEESLGVTGNLNGEQTETRINPDFIADFLATGAGAFTCEWKDGKNAFLLSWPEAAFQYVVMPMRL